MGELNMHIIWYEKLRISTFVLQFYGWLARGFFSTADRKGIDSLIHDNVDRLMLMKDSFKWDGRYDLVVEQQFKTDSLIQQAKKNLKFNQICTDEDIAKYLNGNPDFFKKGIVLHDLSKLIDITSELKRGHFLHDVYHGYPEHYYQYQVDCLDYCYSAYHFYNEGYDYYHGRKIVKNYDEIDIKSIPFTEQKRIQQADEVMLRNFREAYINLIFLSKALLILSVMMRI